MLKIILDTNIILSSVSRNSPYNIIIQKLFNEEFELFVTNDILLEYEGRLQQYLTKKPVNYLLILC